MRSIVLLALLLLSPMLVIAQPDTTQVTPDNLTVSSEVNKTALPQNDTLILTVSFRVSGDIDNYIFHEIKPPTVSNLKLFKTSSANRTAEESGELITYREYRFYYLPVSVGMGYIDPAILSYDFVPAGTTRRLATARIEVEIKEPVKVKKGGFPIWILAVIIAVVLAIVSAYIIIHRRRKTPKEEEIQVPLEEELLEKLKETKQLQKEDPDEFIARISMLTRRYIARKYNIPAEIASREELVQALSELGAPSFSKFEWILNRLDEIKFARRKLQTTETEELYGKLEAILEENLPKGGDNE